MEQEVIQIKGYYDGGPNDRGYVFGYMENDESFWRPATEDDKTWASEVVTDEFRDAFEEKFDKEWTGFYSAYKVDRQHYIDEKEHLEQKLAKYDL